MFAKVNAIKRRKKSIASAGKTWSLEIREDK